MSLGRTYFARWIKAYSAIYKAAGLCVTIRNALLRPFTANGHFALLHGTAGNRGAGGFVNSAVIHGRYTESHSNE